MANVLWAAPMMILHHKRLKAKFSEEIELAKQEFKEHVTDVFCDAKKEGSL